MTISLFFSYSQFEEKNATVPFIHWIESSINPGFRHDVQMQIFLEKMEKSIITLQVCKEKSTITQDEHTELTHAVANEFMYTLLISTAS